MSTQVAVDRERASLLGYLQGQRDVVLAVVEGLDETSMRTSVVPSGWTPLGLLEHLGGAEAMWGQVVLTGTLAPLPWPEEPGAWDPYAPHVSDHDVAEVVQFYRDQCARTDAALERLDLDARTAAMDDPDLPTPVQDVREVVLHLVEETARHAGHLDIARELLDGRTRLGPR